MTEDRLHSEPLSDVVPADTRSSAAGWRRRALVLIVVAAAGVRAIDVWRPIDGSVRQSWRETDTGAIARNFYREDMNILRPRIDWRGDGPGYVESEFPLYPWTAACLYHLFGYHEEILRVMSWLLSMASFAVFLRLAHRLLPESARPVAWTFFAISPMAVRLASAIQPEPLMFCAYLVGIDAFLRWTDHGRRRDYVVALLATTLAILAKIPATHVGLLYAGLCLSRFGPRALQRADLWCFAVISLGVPALWYGYAHTLWLQYGNSLGISNEAYTRISSGSFLLSLTETIPGILSIQAAHVWMIGGLLPGMIGLRAASRSTESRPLIFWAGALAAFFIVTGRTTGENWATYYHIVSVPQAALLTGLGCSVLRHQEVRIDPRLMATVIGAAGIAGLAGQMNAETIGPLSRFALVAGGAAAVAGLVLQWRSRSDLEGRDQPAGRTIPAIVPVAGSLVAGLACSVWQIHRDARPEQFVGVHSAAVDLAQFVPDGSLIIAGGGSRRDHHGMLQASDCP